MPCAMRRQWSRSPRARCSSRSHACWAKRRPATCRAIDSSHRRFACVTRTRRIARGCGSRWDACARCCGARADSGHARRVRARAASSGTGGRARAASRRRARAAARLSGRRRSVVEFRARPCAQCQPAHGATRAGNIGRLGQGAVVRARRARAGGSRRPRRDSRRPCYSPPTSRAASIIAMHRTMRDQRTEP